MPKNLLELLNAAATRGGVEADNQGLKDLLSRTELAQVTVSDEVAGAVDSLLSESAAKNHPAIKAHYVQAFASGLDRKVDALLEDAGELIGTDALEAIKAEKSTGKRTEMAIQALKAAKRVSGTDKATKEQIEKLNRDLVSAREQGAAQVKAEQQKLTDYQRGQAQEKAFGSIKWADSIPETARATIAQTLLSAELAKRGAVAVLHEGNLVLKQATNPELDYYDNGKVVPYADLVQQVAATNKLIAVTPSAGPQATPTHHVQPTGNGGGATPPSSSQRATADAMAAAMADAEKGFVKA